MRILIFCILCLLNSDTQAQEQDREHGFVNKDVSGNFQVWNSDKSEWSDIESFWQDFSITNETKSWGSKSAYPNFDDVNELDTFVIELKQGPCLMQFYHSRWRRANDVQRWNDAFNEYGGCPYVFD